MKKNIVAATILGMVLLAGCSQKAAGTISEKKVKVENVSKKMTTLEQNRAKWKASVKAAKQIEVDQNIKLPDDQGITMANFKKDNKYIIVGTVTNLGKSLDKTLTPETETLIHVDKVLKGDKTIQNKNIKTFLQGGISLAQNTLVNEEGHYTGKKQGISDPDTLVYYELPDRPLPKIGQKIIVGINPSKDSDGYYTIKNQNLTFWTKQGTVYRLNNPGFKNVKNDKKYAHIFKLTKELNEML